MTRVLMQYDQLQLEQITTASIASAMSREGLRNAWLRALSSVRLGQLCAARGSGATGA